MSFHSSLCLPQDPQFKKADSKASCVGINAINYVHIHPNIHADRILRVKMTDGKASCVGIEYQPLPAIKAEQLVPGTKVLLRGCSLRVGVLLLEPRCFEVGGGDPPGICVAVLLG